MTNLWKRAMSITVVVGMLAVVGLAPRVAWADTTTLTFNFTVQQVEGAPELALYAFNGDQWAALDAGVAGNGLGVRVDDRSFGIGLEDGARSQINGRRINAVCASGSSCTLSISGVDTSLQSNGIVFITSGDSSFAIYRAGGGMYDSSNVLLEDASFTISYQENNDEGFDGRAYAIWACGDNDSEVCLHLIEGIENRDFKTEYYLASTITDIKNPSRKFDKFGEYEDEDYMRGMALATEVEKWVVNYTGDASATVTDVDWSKVDIHTFLRGDDMGKWEERLIGEGICEPVKDGDRETLERCVDGYLETNHISAAGVKLQPVGETQGNHSYTSYGDRNFRLTIYDDDYRAIELGTLDGLYYVPSYYQDATFVDAIDISGTTLTAPAIMHSVLLESTLNIKASTVTRLDIASIVPQGVPDGAVTVTKNADGSYKIVFNSNFFDAVTFAIADTAGATYYLDVERSILDTWINEEGAMTTFTFDAKTSYKDYELVATFVYSDGGSMQMVMENAQRIDDGLGNFTHDFETDGGKNLKIATYKANPEGSGWKEGLLGVYFNVRKAGSTDTIYNGTLAGSGRGVYEPAPWRERR